MASTPYTIIGWLPVGFQFPFSGVDVWVTQPYYLMSPFSPYLDVYDAMRALQSRWCSKLATTSIERSDCSVYGTVYRVRCTQEVFGVRGGQRTGRGFARHPSRT